MYSSISSFSKLSNKCKKAGWIILIPSFIVGLFKVFTDFEPGWLTGKVFSIFPDDYSAKHHYFTITPANLTNTLIGTLFIIGALLVGFSKEKNEDEYISGIRLSSLLWAVFVNYFLLLFAFIFI